MNLKMIRLSKPNPDNLFSNYENQLEPQYFLHPRFQRPYLKIAKELYCRFLKMKYGIISTMMICVMMKRECSRNDRCLQVSGILGQYHLKMIFFRLKQHCLELILDIQTIIWD